VKKLIATSFSTQALTDIIRAACPAVCLFFFALGTLHTSSAFAQIGEAVPFDGLDDYIEVDATYAWQDGLTFEARVKVETLDSPQGVISIGQDAEHPAYALVIRADGGIDFYIYAERWTYKTASGGQSGWNEKGPQVIRIQGPARSIIPGQWHHLAATCFLSDDFSADSRSAALYIDGQPVAASVYDERLDMQLPANTYLNGTSTYTRFVAVEQPLLIGVDPSVSSYLKGQLDEVRLWNYARSREQIADASSDVLHGDEDGLMGLWHLDDTVQTIADASTASNDGTLLNGDITAPIITLIGTDEMSTESLDELFLNAYLYDGATASDNFDGELNVVYASDKSLQDPLPGDYRFSYRATDAAGNSSELTRLVHFAGPVLESGYIALRAGEGDWVSATNDGLAAIQGDEIGATEIFYLKNLGTSQYALRAANGKWVSIEEADSDLLIGASAQIGTTEKFQLVARGEGHFALYTANGKFVSAEYGSDHQLHGNRDRIAEWETFAIHRIALSGPIALQSCNGDWVSADPGVNYELIANREQVLPWEIFYLEALDGGFYALRAHNGKWVGKEYDGRLLGNRGQVEEAELLELVPQGEGRFLLKTSDGKYVSSEQDNGGQLRGDRYEVGEWEVFGIQPQAGN